MELTGAHAGFSGWPCLVNVVPGEKSSKTDGLQLDWRKALRRCRNFCSSADQRHLVGSACGALSLSRVLTEDSSEAINGVILPHPEGQLKKGHTGVLGSAGVSRMKSSLSIVPF